MNTKTRDSLAVLRTQASDEIEQNSASAYVGFCPYCAELECDDTCPGPSLEVFS
jgi:hypothetical protein